MNKLGVYRSKLASPTLFRLLPRNRQDQRGSFSFRVRVRHVVRRVGHAKNASKGETGQICDFLRLTLDTQRMEACLPPDKLKIAIEWANSALTQDYMIKDELRSLLGFLSFAAKVVKPGRAFLRRLFTALGEDTSRIRIAGDMRLDLLWWQYFLPRWNGVHNLRSLNTRDEISLWTDASGTWGMGGYYSVHRTPHSTEAGTLSRRSNTQILETTET